MNSISNIKAINRAIMFTMREVKSQRKQLLLTASTDYKLKLQGNIATQALADATWAYSESYRKHKAEYAPGQPYWKYSGDLFNAIRNQGVFGGGFARFVGIPKSARNKKGLSIAKYAMKMEYGDIKNNQPARPVFSKTLDMYFEGKFQKRVDSTIQNILKKWKAK